jgi:arylsulfatase A-like enzyme
MPSRPNILFCLTDQQKATSLDLYTNECSTAKGVNLGRVAEEGTLFENAYCTYPLCVPSRLALMTGRYPRASGYIGNGVHLGPDEESLPDRLRAAGYRSYLTGKDHAFCHARSSGLNPPEGLAKRYDRAFLALHNNHQPPEVCEALPELLPFLLQNRELHRTWGAVAAPWDSDRSVTKLLTDRALEFLEGHLADSPRQPFFLHWGPPDPHEFYQAPRDYAAKFPADAMRLPPNVRADLSTRAEFVRFMHWYFTAGPNPPDEAVMRNQLAIYLAMCQLVDDQFGRLVDFLQKRGLWENTIIVFTSDHGDMTGELGISQKWNGLYDGMMRVPLVVAAPGRGLARGARIRHPVGQIDLAATLCDLAGVEAPAGNQGKSLVPALEGHEPHRPVFLESGIPGPSLGLRDIANFPDHCWKHSTPDPNPTDPPHRWTGLCLGVRDGRYKLITREGQATELYDMQSDPWEMHNLAGQPDLAATESGLKSMIIEHIAGLSGNPRGAFGDNSDKCYQPGQDRPWLGRIHRPWPDENALSEAPGPGTNHK